MEERRIHKSTDLEERRLLNNELRKETDKAKEKSINETYDEITKVHQIGRYDLIYQKTKELE